MKNKIKQTVVTAKKETTGFIQGLEEFVVAGALLLTTYYNYETLGADKAPLEYYARLGASAVIGLLGAWTFVKFIKRNKS